MPTLTDLVMGYSLPQKRSDTSLADLADAYIKMMGQTPQQPLVSAALTQQPGASGVKAQPYLDTDNENQQWMLPPPLRPFIPIIPWRPPRGLT